MSEEGECQATIALFPYGLWSAFLYLIADGLGDALGINTEADAIKEILSHGGVHKHGPWIVEHSLEIGIQMDQQQRQAGIVLSYL